MITKFVQYLLINNIINIEDKEIYEYGVFVLLFNLANILSVILIGFLLDQTVNSVFFLATFIPVRILAGGFHFKSASACCVFFNTCLFFILILIKYQFYLPVSLTIFCILVLGVGTYIEYTPQIKILIPLFCFLFIESILIYQRISGLEIISYAIIFNFILFFVKKLVIH